MAEKTKSFPATTLAPSTPGRERTLRSFSFTTSVSDSFTRCSDTSASTESRNIRFTISIGAFPLRNPRTGTIRRSSVNSCSIRRSTSSAGISTVIFRSTPETASTLVFIALRFPFSIR